MKSPTEQYKTLKNNLKEVASIMNRVPQHECNTRVHHLKVQSFILLSHAAFEEYLEDLVKTVSCEAIKLYKNDDLITKCLVKMMICETIAQLDDGNSRIKIKAEVAKNFSTFAHLAKVNLDKQILKNHGIRLENQKSLLLSIGVDPMESDSSTASALDGFGVKRGNIAHKVKINTEETRKSILSDINVMRDGLLEFDKSACESLLLKMKK